MIKVLSYDDLKKRVLDVSYLTGEFKLRSGQISNYYFNKYMFESDPALLHQVCWHLKQQLPKGINMFAGLEMGGIPIATVLSQMTHIPTIFVRKKAKEYGTMRIAEGMDYLNKNVLVVEDVITSGGQVIESCEMLRKDGANIVGVISVILRDKAGEENIKNHGLTLYKLFDFSA